MMVAVDEAGHRYEFFATMARQMIIAIGNRLDRADLRDHATIDAHRCVMAQFHAAGGVDPGQDRSGLDDAALT
jgi:hypothetical protein